MAVFPRSALRGSNLCEAETIVRMHAYVFSFSSPQSTLGKPPRRPVVSRLHCKFFAVYNSYQLSHVTVIVLFSLKLSFNFLKSSRITLFKVRDMLKNGENIGYASRQVVTDKYNGNLLQLSDAINSVYSRIKMTGY
jgi:hypothetical protein